MPEGHSILRASRLWNTMKGGPLRITSPQGRFATEATAIDGMQLLEAEPYGKHLFLHFSPELIVHIHLALYGKHYVFKGVAPKPKATVRLRVASDEKTIDLIGPALCELLDQEAYQTVLARLGADPLKLEHMPQELIKRMSSIKRPIGQVLMDQTLIAGIGNVYRAEVLFFRAMNPWREANQLSPAEWQSLWSTARELLQSGAELKGRTHTLIPGITPPETMTRPVTPATSERFAYVYGSTGQPCLACDEPVKNEDFYGRTLYYCEHCQL